MQIIDAHEDIAWNILSLGRDVQRSAWETRRLEEGGANPRRNGRCMIGLPEWLEGGIALVIGSIFLSPKESSSHFSWDSQTYTNSAEAHRLAMIQMDTYCRLVDDSDRIDLVTNGGELDDVLSSWEGDSPRVGIIVSMEGADPIRRPGEIEEWYRLGVRCVGLTWASGSRYAGGNSSPGPLTDAGRDLLEAMAEFRMLLDVSHLHEQAFWETIGRYEGPVAATHANPRAFVPTPRQLSDHMIRALAEREGVIGIVPFNRFLRPGWDRSDGKEAVTVYDVAAAIDHVCQVIGNADHVGIGSDFDGGFGAESTPAGLETVADLPKIGEALAERGFTADEINGVMSDNWLRLLRTSLPG